jgi:hypothetical protein
MRREEEEIKLKVRPENVTFRHCLEYAYKILRFGEACGGQVGFWEYVLKYGYEVEIRECVFPLAMEYFRRGLPSAFFADPENRA